MLDMECGAYRCVFCFGIFAIKLPRVSKLFKGLRCNRWEREMWKKWRLIFRWKNLCPIVLSDPTGFFLLMRRAEQPVSFDDIKCADIDYYPDIDVEYKPENWGMIEGMVVCLDYGIAEADLVIQRRAYLKSKIDSFGVLD